MVAKLALRSGTSVNDASFDVDEPLRMFGMVAPWDLAAASWSSRPGVERGLGEETALFT
jgi:hypothetical protein